MSQRSTREICSTSNSKTLNGIDFVEIASTTKRRCVCTSLNNVASAAERSPLSRLPVARRFPRCLPRLDHDGTDWSTDDEGRPMLTLSVPDTRGFLLLHIDSDEPCRSILSYNHATFSFKARCPSDLDCAVPTPRLPSRSGETPAIDYLAKDFMSFRQGPLRLLGAALSRVAGALRGRFRHDVHGGAVQPGRRSELYAGSRRSRSHA